MKLDEFYQSSSLIVDAMSKNETRVLNADDYIDWTKYVTAHYEVTSGKSFDMDITLVDENGNAF